MLKILLDLVFAINLKKIKNFIAFIKFLNIDKHLTIFFILIVWLKIYHKQLCIFIIIYKFLNYHEFIIRNTLIKK